MEVRYPNEPPVRPQSRSTSQKALASIRNSLLIHHRRPSSFTPLQEDETQSFPPKNDPMQPDGKDIRHGMRRLSRRVPSNVRVSTQALLDSLAHVEANQPEANDGDRDGAGPDGLPPPLSQSSTFITSPPSDEDHHLSLAEVDELFRKSTIRLSQISMNASIDFSETDSTTTSYLKRSSFYSNSSAHDASSVTSNDESVTGAIPPLPVLPDPYTAFGGRKSMTFAPSRRYSMPYHTLMATSSKHPYSQTRIDNVKDIDWSRSIGTVNGKRTSLPTSVLTGSPFEENDAEQVKGFAGLGEDASGANEDGAEVDDKQHLQDPSMHHVVDEKTLRKRFNIAMEILDTERYYVKSLMLVERAFLAPLLTFLDPSLTQSLHSTLVAPVTPTMSTFLLTPAPILSRKEINDIFANFVDIVSLNAEILRLLEARLMEPVQEKEGEKILGDGVAWDPAIGCLGDIFLNVAPFLKVYSIYVKNFNTALKALSNCMQRNERFRAFLIDQSQKENLRGLTLEGYLLMPVQRIPRYKLLLEGLLGNTPLEHPDREKLSKAYSIIEEVAMFVNEMIRQQEMFMTMLGIQKGLVGFDEVLLIPGRRLVKTGAVRKICRKNHQLRVFFLFSDILIYASPAFAEGSYTFHRKFSLERCSVVGAEDTDNAKNVFQILSSQKSFAVYSDSLADKESWINTIKVTKQELFDSRSTLRVDDQAHERGVSHYRGYEFPVMFNYHAPVWIPDYATDECQVCCEEFTMFRRKHHCRACGKVICYSCSTRSFIISGQDESDDRLARCCDPCFEDILKVQLSAEAAHATHNEAAPATARALQRRQKPVTDEVTTNAPLLEPEGEVRRTPLRRSTTRRSLAGRKCDLCNGGFGVFRWKYVCDNCLRTVCAECLSNKPVEFSDAIELGIAVSDESNISIKLCDPCHLGINPANVILKIGGGWEVKGEGEENAPSSSHVSIPGIAIFDEENSCSVV